MSAYIYCVCIHVCVCVCVWMSVWACVCMGVGVGVGVWCVCVCVLVREIYISLAKHQTTNFKKSLKHIQGHFEWTVLWIGDHIHNTSFSSLLTSGPNKLEQGILKGEVSLYSWPPIWLVWNYLYDNWPFLFLFAKQTNTDQPNRRSTPQ